MPGPLEGKHIVLGVTGSIACYKAIDLASKLTQAGALVDTIMSYGATQFVTPLAFRSITHRAVVTDTYDSNSEYSIEHVALAHQADVVVIAPATAHCIAKLAQGLADDPLTTTIIATTAPVMVAPAMDANMFDNPATQENVDTLKRRGMVIAGPAPGRLASGLMGMGRLLETPDLLGYISYTMGKDADFKGRKVVVSAGGTMEAIDPVRVITNHSSGKMGYAIAEAARDRGAEVVLVAASTSLPDPALVNVVRVRSAQDMCDEVLRQVKTADALIMAAAVADYRPASEAEQKIKKSADDLTIELAKTTDILEAARGNFVKVGFAAETQDLIPNARDKVTRKGLDLIVANDLTDPQAGFGVDTNKVTFIDGDLKVEDLPVMTKYEVSQCILDRIHQLFPA